MILPTKHLSPSRSLLGVGGILLNELHQPLTVSDLWERVRSRPDVTTFDRFVLGLDLIFMMGLIHLDEGYLKRREID
jgi:hypothetical protein